MLRLRIIHRIRTAAFLLVLTLLVGAVGTLIWANYTGMPKAWRQAFERGIARHGIHAEIGALSYNPLEGITARKVTVYASEERKQVISRLEGIILDLDNAKLAKGEIQLARVKLNDARLFLPVYPDDPDSEVLEIDNINGEFIPPGNPHIEIRNARGRISGIDLVLNARIADDRRRATSDQPASQQKNNGELLARVIRELRQWSFDSEAPPEIRIQCTGRRSQMDQIKASISFRAKSVEKNQHTIEHIQAEAELHENMLSVHNITAVNGNRRMKAHLDYDTHLQHGRFDIDCTLEIPELLQSWLGFNPLSDLLIAGSQEVRSSGEFQLITGKPPSVHATGQASCEFASLKGIRFDQIRSDFAWRDGVLFLKDLSLARPDGEVRGKALIQPDLVRLNLHSTLLPEFYRPLFDDEQAEELIANFATNPDSRMELHIEGGYDRNDPESWAYAGKLKLEKMSYRGVGLAFMETKLSASSSQMDFADGAITFDYSDYPMAIRHAGPKSGELKFESVRYRSAGGQHASFSGLEGKFWPAPLCRMFTDQTADILESYEFQHPPQIFAAGSIDLQDTGKTHVKVDFSSKHPAVISLLETPVILNSPKARVEVTGEDVNIHGLSAGVFEGEVVSNMRFPAGKAMSVELQASKFSINSINSTFGMNMNCGGLVAGNLDFQMLPGQIGSMQGKGNLSLVQAELFSVPIFGPLSRLMQSVLNDNRVGAERAKEASCNFLIQDGVVASNDFRTTTTSLIFAGEGWIDLDRKTMDMTMRLNARGLLGILTLPLRPFYGLFQFRGVGPLKGPEWKRVMFTKPRSEIQQLLLEKTTDE